MDTLDKIFLHQIAAPGLPGNISDPEAAAIRADQAAIMARPVVERLLDLLDVSGSPVDGDIILYDAVEEGWVTSSLPQGIVHVYGAGGPAEGTEGPFRRLSIWPGLRYIILPEAPNTLHIAPQFGTAAGTVAVGNHTHEVLAEVALPFGATGSLSSGTRPLFSGTVSGLNPATTYRISAELRGEVRGEGTGAGRSHPSITLSTVTRNRFSGSGGYVRTVAGVDREFSMHHPGLPLYGVTSVAVAAAISHIDGDPKYVGGGELTIRLRGNR